MIRREVVVRAAAKEDLRRLARWVAEQASEEVALGYLGRIEAFIEGLDLASERGTARDDIRPGLRIIGFERRLTIAFAVRGSRVLVLRVFRSGRNWTDAWR